MELGIADFSLPGVGLEEKLRMAEKHGLWLEIANDGVAWKLSRWKSLLPSFNVKVRSVQAFMQHWISLLSKNDVERKAAKNHIVQTIELASLFSAEHVVAVIGYGTPGVADPDAVIVGVLRDIARIAGDRGVTIGLEPLDIKRTNYRPTATSVREIVELVNDDHLKLMVDTGHLWENGENILEILKRFGGECSEIHLKDSGSRAPGCGDIDFKPIIDACIELKGLKCLEYRPSGDPRRDLEEALRTIRKS